MIRTGWMGHTGNESTSIAVEAVGTKAVRPMLMEYIIKQY